MGSANTDLILRAAVLLQRVEFQSYAFSVSEGHGGVYLKADYDEPDTYTGVVERQHTRKWLLSPHMTDSEIVQTAFKLCLTSMEHRARESFTYKGARIFGPHFDVEDLARLCVERERAGARDAAASRGGREGT